MKSAFRTAVLRVADRLGINRRLERSRWRARQCAILCYHGFALRDEHEWDPQLFISSATLEKRLAFLRRNHYVILALDQALPLLVDGTLPERAVVLTVDDGLYDFAAVAYPLLAASGVPATVYVSTYYVEHRWPVFDVMLGYVLWRAARSGRTRLQDAPDSIGTFPIAAPSDRLEAGQRIKAAARERRLSGEEKEHLLRRVAEAGGVDYDDLLASRMLSLMRPEEIRRLDPALADLQLHTHRHQTPEDRPRFLGELEENRAALARCGRPRERLIHFCYPSGVYRPEFLPWLREAGVVSAVIGEPGLASRETEPLLLPRFIDTERTSDAEFAAWVSGLRGVLNRRRLGL